MSLQRPFVEDLLLDVETTGRDPLAPEVSGMGALFLDRTTRGTKNRRVWVVVAEDLPEICALLRHCLGSRLAKSDPVSLAGSLQTNVFDLLLHDEVVTRNRAPSQPANDSQAR